MSPFIKTLNNLHLYDSFKTVIQVLLCVRIMQNFTSKYLKNSLKLIPKKIGYPKNIGYILNI